MPKRTFLLEIFLVSLAAIVLEISFTRIFSFKLYYYFTYLILGIAMLGLGSGGVMVAVSRRLREGNAENILIGCSLIGALLVPASYFLVATTQLNTIDFVENSYEIARLVLVCGSLFAPFLCVGIALASLFGSFPEDMNRLYFADLLGAGLGCAICVPVFSVLSPAAGIMLAGSCLASAGAIAAHRCGSSHRTAGVALACLLLAATAGHRLLPEPVPDRTKTLSPQLLKGREVLFSSWSALFRIDVLPVWGNKNDGVYLIAHDGNAGSGLHKYNGDPAMLASLDKDIRLEPFSLLKKDPHVLIIGAAGGHEILASQYYGAGKITAVELNPVTVSLLTDHFADYTGQIAQDPRVDLINAEGRAFVQNSDEKYDLIWFVAPDSYAAMNAASSGAFVLSESYLFTVEMIRESLEHLTENGIVCVQWGELFGERNRATRYLATARQTFEDLGVANPSDHIVLSTGPGLLPTSTIILRNEPFVAEDIKAYEAAMAPIPSTKLWHPTGGAKREVEHPMTKVLDLESDELERWFADYEYNVTPIRDDSPFFWHFTRFDDAFGRPWRATKDVPAWELATGEQTLMILLGLAIVFAAVFLLLPLAFVRDVWSRVPMKRYAAVYFASLGLGFMFFEVVLIQKLTLVLGYPTYSLTVTLFSLLIFSGIGSLGSQRMTESLGRDGALFTLLGTLAGLTVFYLFGIGPLESLFAGASFPARLLLAIVALAPLGLCLGSFMPIGIATIAASTTHAREYIAWSWAVNGFFSVVSSVASTILAMTFGFNAVLLLAVGVYGVGILALRRIPAPA